MSKLDHFSAPTSTLWPELEEFINGSPDEDDTDTVSLREHRKRVRDFAKLIAEMEEENA